MAINLPSLLSSVYRPPAVTCSAGKPAGVQVTWPNSAFDFTSASAARSGTRPPVVGGFRKVMPVRPALYVAVVNTVAVSSPSSVK